MTYEVIVKMVSKKTHHIRMRAKSAQAAMAKIVLQLQPFEVFSLSIKEEA